MSTAAGDPKADSANDASVASPDKGKGKAPKEDTSMEVEEDDEEEEEEEEEEEGEDDDDEEVEEDFSEINPEVITSRRTRGKKVDYTSPEALAKAGLAPETADDDDDDEMKS